MSWKHKFITMKSAQPNFSIENTIHGPVCGLDEVGRAPLAGPVMAACVYVPENLRDHAVWKTVNDSKKLSKKKREALFGEVQNACLWGLGESSAREIETLNIVQASFLAMRRAFAHMHEQYKPPPGLTALIDGHITPKVFPCPTQTVIKGDQKSLSIAAASILAKVTRDRLMGALAEDYPYYGWERNAAYPTREHLEGIQKHGITKHHRTTFAPVQNYMMKENIRAAS